VPSSVALASANYHQKVFVTQTDTSRKWIIWDFTTGENASSIPSADPFTPGALHASTASFNDLGGDHGAVDVLVAK
jgi:hypothetical protein